jgi:hypothetical protein
MMRLDKAGLIPQLTDLRVGQRVLLKVWGRWERATVERIGRTRITVRCMAVSPGGRRDITATRLRVPALLKCNNCGLYRDMLARRDAVAICNCGVAAEKAFRPKAQTALGVDVA